MRKRTIIRLVVFFVIIGAAVGGYVAFGALNQEPAPRMSHTVLQTGDLSETINIRGSVESTNRRNIHSTLNFPVAEVLVEVGDFVSEGDVLAVLDSGDLELNIRQQRAELGAVSENSLHNLVNSRRMYDDARANLQTGQNPQVLNAENAHRTAAANLETALRNFEEAYLDYNNPNNAQVLSARSNVSMAQIDLDNAQRVYDNNRMLFNAGGVTRNALENSESALAAAQSRYNDAVEALEVTMENMETNIRRALDNAETQLANARINYENTASALVTTVNAANQELTRLLANVDSAQIAVNNDARLIAIERLERQLADSVITSPTTGTVTAVFAREGAMGSGLLFVIEDTENLKITTRIREYDAVSVRIGMEVEIRTDSTGQEVFEGVISSIAPTAVRNAQGDIASLGDVEFAAEVSVVSNDTPLLIGMNTRLNVVLDRRTDVFFVPFDAVGFDVTGDNYVFLADVGEYGATARRLPVDVGLETDFFVEIISPELADGMVVLNNAAAITEGMEVTLN